jgi:Family of unknown function (DUF6470)
MRIPQIRMQSTQAVLGIEKSNASIDIQQSHAQVELQQPKAIMDMKSVQPKLTIDQTQAWADMNLKSILRRNEEFAAEGNQAWIQYLAKTAQEGGELMKIENGGGVIAAQAKRNGQLPKHEFGLGFIPSSFSVKFNYQPGEVRINIQPQKVVSNITVHQPIIHYQSGNINYHLNQQNSLQIDFVT